MGDRPQRRAPEMRVDNAYRRGLLDSRGLLGAGLAASVSSSRKPPLTKREGQRSEPVTGDAGPPAPAPRPEQQEAADIPVEDEDSPHGNGETHFRARA